MKNIGIVDDDKAVREATKISIDLILKKNHEGWNVVVSEPFKKFSDYKAWILEEEISVLILDERLNNRKLEDGSYAHYFGSELVKELRKTLKDFPIFCLTSISISEELRAALKHFNMIISSQQLEDEEEEENFVNLFVRSGTSFYKENKKKLSRLNELTEKTINHHLTTNEIEEIEAIQTDLLIPHLFDEIVSREEVLKKTEQHISELLEIKEEIKKMINQ